MSDIVTLSAWGTSVALVCWMVHTLLRRVDEAQKAAAQSHVLAVLERERCERLVAECREIKGECHLAAAVAHDAAADAEEYAESVEPFGDGDDEEDEPWR